MRFGKTVQRYLPVKQNLALVWTRINSSRVTLAYFIFTVLHCVIQVVLQVQAFRTNAAAAGTLNSLLTQANISTQWLAVLEGGDLLRLCDGPEHNNVDLNCRVIWNGTAGPVPLPGTVPEQVQDQVISADPAATATVNEAFLSSSSVAPAASSSRVAAVTSTLAAGSSVAAATVTPAAEVQSSGVVASSPKASSVAGAASSSSASVGVAPEQDGVTPVGTSKSAKAFHPFQLTPVQFMPGGSSAKFRREIVLEVEEEFLPNRFANAKRSLEKRASGNRQLTLSSLTDPTGNVTGYIVSGLPDGSAAVPTACIQALVWPLQTLNNSKRMDVTIVLFQVWVLGMSLVALLNESIPHIFAALVTHALATAYTGFQLATTDSFKSDFNRITDSGCGGVKLLDAKYWAFRISIEIALAVLNAAALIGSALLSWLLVKLFGWQTFKRIGASVVINRIYKYVLTFSIAIQLASFFILAAAGLWFDQLSSAPLEFFAEHVKLYRAISATVFLLVIPWLALGWFSVRKEAHAMMMSFLFLSFIFIGVFILAFFAESFLVTFRSWRFFAIIVAAAGGLTSFCIVIGMMCGFNFGKGLLRYLQGQEELDEKPYIRSYKVTSSEKVDFPSNNEPIPSFSVTFGSTGGLPVLPSQMSFGNPRPAAQQQQQAKDDRYTTRPPRTPNTLKKSRSVSSRASSFDNLRLDRTESKTADDLDGSSSEDSGSKRWMIE